ncbi:hypothetical protein FF2_046309 [Malus domestica]
MDAKPKLGSNAGCSHVGSRLGSTHLGLGSVWCGAAQGAGLALLGPAGLEQCIELGLAMLGQRHGLPLALRFATPYELWACQRWPRWLLPWWPSWWLLRWCLVGVVPLHSSSC